MSWEILGALLLVLMLALMAGTAGACQICIPLPERTLADRLLASDAVVLAREDAERGLRLGVHAPLPERRAHPGPDRDPIRSRAITEGREPFR